MNEADRPPWPVRAWVTASLARLIVSIGALTFIDPDLWHEMATARWMWVHGAVPVDDPFAYTPTVSPVVHHEWGLGMVAWGLGHLGGEPALMAFRFALVGVIAACTWRLAFRGGASPVMVVVSAFIAVGSSLAGFTTIRALVLTLVGVAGTLAAFDRDRAGRRWAAPWLLGWLVWENVHGGAIVGLFLLGAHAAEQALRRRPYVHVVGVAVAAVALVPLNPWGIAYLRYLATAPFMDRPLIGEWGPLWSAPPFVIAHAVVMILLAAYGFARIGPARAIGALVLAATMVAAVQHARHLPIFAVVWLATVPAWLTATPLGELLDAAWRGWPRTVVGLAAAVGVIGGVSFVRDASWRVSWPADLYPVAALDHLEAVGFRGRLATPFVQGGYALYRLAPYGAKVSFDGRYEVAYPPGALEDNLLLYAAEPGWKGWLAAHPSDAVLVPTTAPLAAVLPTDGWVWAYQDDAWAVAVRPGWTHAAVDRRGLPAPRGRFP